MNRTIEYCITIIFLIIAVPLLLIVAVIVLFSSGRPVFYFQERSGLNGTTFTIVKFRTMQDVSRPDGTQLSDEFRLDKIGKFLRASSLDRKSVV